MLHSVDRILDGLLPRACVFCGLNGGPQACCAGCRDDLPWISRPCRRCGSAVPPEIPRQFCVDCPLATGGSSRVLSAFFYEYPIDRVIAGAKFRQRLDFASMLGSLLGIFLRDRAGLSAIDLPDVIIPVPLHRRRLARRGFNQAAEIAAPIAACLGLPLGTDACVRIRHTPEQMSLTGRIRRRNLIGAFVARPDLADVRVAIVDDVMTTGTTARAVAAAVRKAGARDTQIWTVARTR